MDRRLAALFVDFENVALALANQYGFQRADSESAVVGILGKVEKYLSDHGVHVVLRRAFADWSQYPTAASELYRMGVRTDNVAATVRKNSADIELSLSVQDIMLTRDDIEELVVVAGDRDYMPVAMRVMEHAKGLKFVSFRECFSGDLKALLGSANYVYVDPKGELFAEGETAPPLKADQGPVSELLELAHPPSPLKELRGDAGAKVTLSPSQAQPTEELSEAEQKALRAAIEAYREYEPKYGDVKLAGFLMDRLAFALPALSHLERKEVFRSLEAKGLLKTWIKDGFWGDSFVVFNINESHPLVLKGRVEMGVK